MRVEQLNYSVLASAIGGYIARTGDLPNQTQLAKILDLYNQKIAPDSEKAGSIACQIGRIKVIVNHRGFLEIGPTDTILSQPLHQSTQRLTSDQIEQVKTIYRDLINDCPFNNLAPMLEFLKFYREAKSTNPHLSLREAFLAFHPNLHQLYEKYQSGDCIILGAKLTEALREQGFDVENCGEIDASAWSRPPIPNPLGSSWSEFDTATGFLHHVMTTLFYVTENGSNGLLLQSGNMTNNDWEEFGTVGERNGWEHLMARIDSRNTPHSKRAITNLDHLVKAHLSGRSKMVIVVSPASGEKQILGVDLLRNNLYLNTAGAAGITGLPCNAAGKVVLLLEDLAHPDSQKSYWIDGQEIKLTHRQALTLFFERARGLFLLPDDFCHNLLSLAENIETLFDQVLLHPLQTVRAVHEEAQNIFDMQEDAKKQLRSMDQPPAATKTLHQQMSDVFKTLQNSILKNNLKSAWENIREIKVLQAKFQEIALCHSLTLG